MFFVSVHSMRRRLSRLNPRLALLLYYQLKLVGLFGLKLCKILKVHRKRIYLFLVSLYRVFQLEIGTMRLRY